MEGCTKLANMTLTKTIEKAEKISGSKIQKSGHLFFVDYKGYTVSFFPNGRLEDGVEATNFYTKRIDLKDDFNSDYFAGTFHDNISQAFRFIDRKK
jgi:hypothetical protein